jgi:hypothetical protein
MRLLSRYVASNFDAIDQRLNSLDCCQARISEIDVDVNILRILLARYEAPFIEAWLEHHRRSPSTPNDVCCCAADKSSLNIAICHKLSVINLQGNTMQNILGIVVFQNVTQLNVSNNNIHSIAACEPLSCLPRLEVLQLFGNPVEKLIHYRAHLIRICSVGTTHSTPTRYQTWLKCIDGKRITEDENINSVKSLNVEEAYFLPALRHVILRSIVNSFSSRVDLHNEMRRRGLLVSDVAQPLSFFTVMTICIEVGQVSRIATTHHHRSHVEHQLRRLASAFQGLQRVHAFTSKIEEQRYCAAHAATEASASCLGALFLLAEKLQASQAEAVRWYSSLFSSHCGQSTTHPQVAASSETRFDHRGEKHLLQGFHKKFTDRALRRCLTAWKFTLKAHLHRKRALLQRSFRIWVPRFRTLILFKKCTANAKHFSLGSCFRLWKLRCDRKVLDQAMLRAFAIKHAGSALRVMIPVDKQFSWSEQLNLRRVVLLQTLSRMRQKCVARQAHRFYFRLWMLLVTTKPNVDMPQEREQIDVERDAEAVQPSDVHDAPHQVVVKQVASNSVQCELMNPAALIVVPQYNQLCETLQLEKLRLVHLVTSLEKELAESRLYSKRLSATVDSQKSKINAISMDRDQAHDAVAEYERERIVHLELIKRLTLHQ